MPNQPASDEARIVFRMIPDAGISAWWRGEMLPVIVGDFRRTDSTEPFSLVGQMLHGAKLGPEVTEEELAAVSPETRAATPIFFDKEGHLIRRFAT